jgi:hypothetical protein
LGVYLKTRVPITNIPTPVGLDHCTWAAGYGLCEGILGHAFVSSLPSFRVIRKIGEVQPQSSCVLLIPGCTTPVVQLSSIVQKAKKKKSRQTPKTVFVQPVSVCSDVGIHTQYISSGTRKEALVQSLSKLQKIEAVELRHMGSPENLIVLERLLVCHQVRWCIMPLLLVHSPNCAA